MNATEYYGNLLKEYIPGGCHTYSKGDDQWPLCAPKCIKRGRGAYVWDADEIRYVDWCMGLTSVAFGHANEEINNAAKKAMDNGHNFQRPSVIEACAAERFIEFQKDRGEMVKFAKNGSTVTDAAVRLARAYTGRRLVAICGDHPFFGYGDFFIGAQPCHAGIPDEVRNLTLKFTYNNLHSIRSLFAEHPGEIACLIMEPTKFQRPESQFLQNVLTECHRNGALLVFDEMVTGLKFHKQGASKHYNAKADLYTWGKSIANGHSVAAITGRRDVMELGSLDYNQRRVFFCSSTHGAEIPQLAAMMKVLDIVESDPEIFDRNWKKGAELRRELGALVQVHGLDQHLGFIGEDCFFSVKFCSNGGPAPNIAKTFLLQELIKEGQLFQGIFFPTVAHDSEIIEATVAAWEKVLPVYRQFIEQGDKSQSIRAPIRPVLRAYNNCDCSNHLNQSCPENALLYAAEKVWLK